MIGERFITPDPDLRDGARMRVLMKAEATFLRNLGRGRSAERLDMIADFLSTRCLARLYRAVRAD